MNDICKNIKECYPNKKCKILIVPDGIIPDMISHKKLKPIVTELFIRHRKLDISLFLQNLILLCHKRIKLNSTHSFIMKTPNKQELEQNALNHSSDIFFNDFRNLYKKYTAKPYAFLVIDATLALDNTLRFRKNLFESI